MAADRKGLLDSGLISLLESRDLNIRALMDGMFGGNRRTRAHGTSSEFAEYREYIPGDDLRRVDWNLYGRFDKMYLKLYTDERRQHHRVLIDCSASMAWGDPEKRLYALRLASVLGYLAVSGMDVISYYTLRGAQCRPVTQPVTGRDAWYLANEALGAVSCGGESDLQRAIDACPDPGRNDGVTFIISDLLTDSDWKTAADRLLGRKREVCVVRVLSRDEIAPSFGGKLELRDSEAVSEDDRRNLRMDIQRPRLRAYAAACEWLENDIRAFCASRNIRFLQLCTDEDLSRVLFTRAIESEMIL